MKHALDIPWLCAGDYNELVRQDEKLGGALCNHQQIQLFRDAIENVGLWTLALLGQNFHGANILRMGILYGKDLIEVRLLIIGS